MMCYCQEAPLWINWEWLSGEWQGEGSGIPGEGNGTFSFIFDLDNNILVRKSHSEYSTGDFKRKNIRDDLMIVYNGGNNKYKAIFFDNEGHIINYNIALLDSSIVFTSEPVAGSPVFRLIYEKINPDIVNTKFEMSRDGLNFMTYVEGKSRKIHNISGGIK